MKATLRTATAALLAAAMAAGCTGPSARMKTDDEGTLVDVSKGGTETYKALISKGVTQVLEEHRLTLAGGAERPLIAFLGIRNKSSEELGEFKDAMTNEIETALVGTRYYQVISMEAVYAAQREANIRDIADLTTNRGREAFLAVLNKDGRAPQFLFYGESTTMSSQGIGERERTYQLKLQMLDSSNGIVQTQKMVEVRKAYEE